MMQKSPDANSDDIKFIKIGNTTYEVCSNYVGTQTLLELVKNAIRRDVESMNYENFYSKSKK